MMAAEEEYSFSQMLDLLEERVERGDDYVLKWAYRKLKAAHTHAVSGTQKERKQLAPILGLTYSELLEDEKHYYMAELVMLECKKADSDKPLSRMITAAMERLEAELSTTIDLHEADFRDAYKCRRSDLQCWGIDRPWDDGFVHDYDADGEKAITKLKRWFANRDR